MKISKMKRFCCLALIAGSALMILFAAVAVVTSNSPQVTAGEQNAVCFCCQEVGQYQDCNHEERGMEMSSNGKVNCPARLCNSCGFGSKKDYCVKCGKWIASSDTTARLCSSCGFGNKKDNCVKCGHWIGSQSYEAKLCNSCGFGNKGQQCVKCGHMTD